MKETNNLLYIYLQRKLLQATNQVTSSKGFITEESRNERIEELQKDGRLNLELDFTQAKQVLNKWHNIPNKIVIPIIYIMRDLELLEIKGKFNHMKIRIINIHKGRLISKTNQLYSICF